MPNSIPTVATSDGRLPFDEYVEAVATVYERESETPRYAIHAGQNDAICVVHARTWMEAFGAWLAWHCTPETHPCISSGRILCRKPFEHVRLDLYRPETGPCEPNQHVDRVTIVRLDVLEGETDA
jgi:hypothetical protein